MATVDGGVARGDRAPVPVPAGIQPNGCLLAFSEPGHCLTRFSENAAVSLNLPLLRIGMPIGECVGGAAATILGLPLREHAGRPGICFDVALIGGLRRDVTVHRTGDEIVIEFEAPTPARLHAHLAAQQRMVLEWLRDPVDAGTLLASAASALRQAFGYDRVMIYRFAPDWSGQIVADDRKEGLESLLGQFFSPSHIPVQARTLYRRLLIRVVGETPSRRVPLIDGPGLAPLNLSFMHLRAVSPLHGEYLARMGVCASMSISLIVDGALWGLIAFHHYSPRLLFMAERIAAKILGEFIALQIMGLNRSRRLRLARDAHLFFSRVIRDASGTAGLGHYIHGRLPELLELVSCDGGGLWTEQKWHASGLALPESDVRLLLDHTGATVTQQIWSTDCLTGDCAGFVPSVPDLCGALIIPVWPGHDDCLILFRRESVQAIHWGAARGGLEIGTEEVRGRSARWTTDDLELAGQYRSALMEIVARASQQKLLERTQAEAMQRMLNDELNHRVRNILAVIRSLTSRPPDAHDTAASYRDMIGKRIHAFANAHDLAVSGKAGILLHDLLAIELAPYRTGTNRVSLVGPDIRLSGRALTFLALLFHELATNAVKYGALSVADGCVAVTWQHDRFSDTCAIRWQERGGPPVRPPGRSGFGSLLIDRAVVHDLKGTAARHFDPDGMRLDICFPFAAIVEHLHADGLSSAEQQNEEAGPAILKDRTILVLEDEFIIAMELEDVLGMEHGARVHIASTLQAAFDILEAHSVDVAILDVNIAGESSLPVARALSGRGIPFLFATGYGSASSAISAFPDVPVLAKPYTMAGVVAALGAVMRPGGGKE
ncbi:HWE histidine kinase domain-containing protein [Gluconacetobacter takamatsuzukensis]|uniref:histidine kinase n=1 Tax=Gluconacetobacter takamatsuzukensis TaxID=1286190 RepID=A0A7W4KC82_9PROT|nr:HWE histidine kinase domain-containing protein [Gluconacetobacter takamatsuzukensis]MBB2204253.1 GAF domain-containing protein [Gluconacetobacter takamatsuzukensis]